VSSVAQIKLVKLSNVVQIEPEPFSAETYEAEEEAYIDDAGNSRVKLKHLNTIRWRTAVGQDGQVGRVRSKEPWLMGILCLVWGYLKSWMHLPCRTVCVGAASEPGNKILSASSRTGLQAHAFCVMERRAGCLRGQGAKCVPS
jgi:Leo1-like protein